MASENAHRRRSQRAGSASENTKQVRRGRPPAELSGPYAAVLEKYANDLASAPLADQTRRTYLSKARQYLAWLADAELDGDPLSSADGRDWAVRDYGTYLQAVLKRRPATVNSALAAVDDLYIRRGLGPANAKRIEIPAGAPRALNKRAQIRYLRAVQMWSSRPARAAIPVMTSCAPLAVSRPPRRLRNMLRHSFATTLVRGGTDLIIAAELLGHARLETTRIYTRPTAEDRLKAVDLLPVDE